MVQRHRQPGAMQERCEVGAWAGSYEARFVSSTLPADAPRQAVVRHGFAIRAPRLIANHLDPSHHALVQRTIRTGKNDLKPSEPDVSSGDRRIAFERQPADGQRRGG